MNAVARKRRELAIWWHHYGCNPDADFVEHVFARVEQHERLRPVLLPVVADMHPPHGGRPGAK